MRGKLEGYAEGIATHCSRKAGIPYGSTAVVCQSTTDGEVVEPEGSHYCIAGSRRGLQAIKSTVFFVLAAANNKDVGFPVYISDGKTEPFCLNEVDVAHARDVIEQRRRTPEEEATIRTAREALDELYRRVESKKAAKHM